MENILTSLKIACVNAGTNLTEVCRRAGVHRSVVDRWERELPKSFKTLEALHKAVEEINVEKLNQQSKRV